MSHIAFDLDALPLVPKVARSAGIGEAVVGWGLTQMWEWCWRHKTDRVTTNHLRGFFGAELGAVLVDFGFLEAIGALWRVRGAARYLRIQDGRIRGGKAAAAAGNLKRGLKRTPAHAPASPSLHSTGSQPTSQAASRVAPAYIQPTSTPAPAAPQLIPSCPPAGSQHTSQLRPRLSATSDKRLATSDKLTTSEPARSRVLSDRLVAAFLEKRRTPYKFTSSVDGPALARLLKACPDNDEIDRRWRLGLDGTYQREVNTIAQLDAKWNALTKPDAKERPRDEETTYETQTWIGGVRQ